MEGTMQMMTSAVLRRIEATSQSDAFATRFGSGSLGGQHALHAALILEILITGRRHHQFGRLRPQFSCRDPWTVRAVSGSCNRVTRCKGLAWLL